MKKPYILMLLICGILFFSCNDSSEERAESKMDSVDKKSDIQSIKEQEIKYSAGNTQLKGYIYYDEKQSACRPIVLVVHEWWGLTDYPRMRARMLAELGYIAMAVDIYGDGKTVDNPTDAQNAATPFFQNPGLAKERLDAALAKAKTFPQADTSRAVAIGYCFGGAVVLNSAKLGSNLDGVVSFHGALEGVPAKKELLSSKILVCHGGSDNFVPDQQVKAFRKSMDSIGADYTFKVYPGATHAFTNPEADRFAEKFKLPVKYDAKADSASWNDMKMFFSTIFK